MKKEKEKHYCILDKTIMSHLSYISVYQSALHNLTVWLRHGLTRLVLLNIHLILISRNDAIFTPPLPIKKKTKNKKTKTKQTLPEP